MITNVDVALKKYSESVLRQIKHTLLSVDLNAINSAAELIKNAQKHHGRLHITGIGKPGHLAGYIASLISSTGTPAYFLHGTEAVHGSSGQLVEGDIVVAISNSGNTDELIETILCAKINKCKIIGVTGNRKSKLSKLSDVVLIADLVSGCEGGPLDRAPRNSILAETIVLQMLSIILQVNANITPEQYIMHHPHGALGKLHKDEWNK